MSFKPICTTRGSAAAVTLPKVAAFKFVLTAPAPPKKGVLVKLYASQRYWRRTFSRIFVILMSEKSEFTNPGARSEPRPALPKKLPLAISALLGMAKAERASQSSGRRDVLVGSPTMFGRLLVNVLPNEMLSEGVSGKPPCSDVIPLHCQPPTRAFTRCEAPPRKCLPEPIGSS